ncbi:hypothetical protein B0H16DRAFT_1696551 [Mycena metata]|uniref:Uncharacterized protein n=1 Tax=Mycena metata TaxID=1033252 RepID=A0AAD7HZY3_9AGAR|nr:hypothetical protein B0H16DRAFT_1696551 [Mycena metata]
MDLAEFPGVLARSNSERGRAEMRKGIRKLERRRQVVACLRNGPIPAETDVGSMVNNVEYSFYKCAVWIIPEVEIPGSAFERRRYKRKGVRVGRDRICTGIRIWTRSRVETRRKKVVIGQGELGSREQDEAGLGVAVDSTKRSNGSAGPDKTGADRNGPVCGSKSAGVERGAMDSKQRSGGKPSSALDRHTMCRRLVGLKRLERTRRPYEVRTKASEDCRRGGPGMNSFERCRDPGELRMKGDAARDQEELWE